MQLQVMMDESGLIQVKGCKFPSNMSYCIAYGTTEVDEALRNLRYPADEKIGEVKKNHPTK